MLKLNQVYCHKGNYSYSNGMKCKKFNSQLELLSNIVDIFRS